MLADRSLPERGHLDNLIDSQGMTLEKADDFETLGVAEGFVET